LLKKREKKMNLVTNVLIGGVSGLALEKGMDWYRPIQGRSQWTVPIIHGVVIGILASFGNALLVGAVIGGVIGVLVARENNREKQAKFSNFEEIFARIFFTVLGSGVGIFIGKIEGSSSGNSCNPNKICYWMKLYPNDMETALRLWKEYHDSIKV
jgi:hypothetical protein